MEPARYRPSDAALNFMLFISGFLRDLGELNSDKFLEPHITSFTVPPNIDAMVRKMRKSIRAEAQTNTEHRLTLQIQAAFGFLEQMQEAANAGDLSCVALLQEKRQYKFSEVPLVGWQTVTLGEMLTELTKTDWLGNAPCMNFLGGQVQDYIAELWVLPKRPQ